MEPEINEEILNQMLLEFAAREDSYHKVIPRVYHASSVFSCYRKNFYKQTGVAATNPMPLGVFERGRRVEDALHESVVHKFGARNVIRGVGISHGHDGWRRTGKTDTLISVEGNPHTLIEWKSTEELRSGPFTPFKSYLGQLGFYASHLWARGLKHAWIAQASSTNLAIRAKEMTEAESSYWDFEGEKFFADLDAIIQVNMLPPAKPFNDWECENKNCACQFLDRCRADGGWKKVEFGGDVEWIRSGDGR